MVTHARQVLDPAAAEHNHRVFLQIMPLAGNVSRHFHAVGQPYAGDFAERGIGLFGSDGEDLDANSPLERRSNFFRPILQNVKIAS